MPAEPCLNPVRRDVATPQLALHLLGPPTNPRHDNWVDPSVKLGAKTTVGAGCIIGPGTAVGDKGSVKRSVVGSDCRIGSNAKVPELSTLFALGDMGCAGPPPVRKIQSRLAEKTEGSATCGAIPCVIVSLPSAWHDYWR